MLLVTLVVFFVVIFRLNGTSVPILDEAIDKVIEESEYPVLSRIVKATCCIIPLAILIGVCWSVSNRELTDGELDRWISRGMR